MHESFSKKKIRKDRVFNRGSLIRQKMGPDFVVCMNSEKVVKYPEACVRFRVTFLIELERTLTSSLYLIIRKDSLPCLDCKRYASIIYW